MSRPASTDQHPVPPTSRLPGEMTWVLDELTFVWKCAEAQASEAYEDWAATGGRDSYVVYVAARDRADAAARALAAHGEGSHDTTTSNA